MTFFVSCRKLKIVATRRQHINLPDDMQLIDYLAAFPSLASADIRWGHNLSGTQQELREVPTTSGMLANVQALQIAIFGPWGGLGHVVTSQDIDDELKMLLRHLQLPQVRTVRIKVEVILWSIFLEDETHRIQRALGEMNLPSMEEFNLDLLVVVEDGPPETSLAVSNLSLQ
jgi:hypothetical protein